MCPNLISSAHEFSLQYDVIVVGEVGFREIVRGDLTFIYSNFVTQ